MYCGNRSVKDESAHPPLHSSAVRHYVSPRDFLGLIRAFVSLVNEKRAELEDQQVPSCSRLMILMSVDVRWVKQPLPLLLF